MHFLKIAQYGLGGHRICGQIKSIPACQSPFINPSGIVVPSGFARSAIVMTRRYIQTMLAFFRMPVVIPAIFANLSMIDASPSCCRGGVHAFSIHRNPLISARRLHTSIRKLLLMYLIGGVVFLSMGVVNPDISWIWSRVTSMLFAVVLSYWSCFRRYTSNQRSESLSLNID